MAIRNPGHAAGVQLASAAGALLALSAPFLARGAGGATKEPPEPARPGYVESAKISLILLDVEVADGKGRPVPGLTKEDFQVTLDYKLWPIYSVDDLCSGEASAQDAAGGPGQAPGSIPPGERAENPSSIAGAPGSVTGTSPAAKRSAGRFVLYFDFSELQADGRHRALKEARRWVRDVMREGDRAMVAAYAPTPGIKELCGWTGDRRILLSAIDKADTDIAFADSFPALMGARMKVCRECVCSPGSLPSPGGLCWECEGACLAFAQQEQVQARAALRALKVFLARLERDQGRKVLLFFHQNSMVDPTYPYARTERIAGLETGGELRLLEEVGAEATTSRTVINPVFTGQEASLESGVAGAAVNFGANLADFTGGRYNRGPQDLSKFVEGAGTGPACLYRIGLEPPDSGGTKTYQVVVTAAGRRIDSSYRVQFLSEQGRWLRDALAALEHPETARDLELRVAAVPVRMADGRWDITAEVALDLDALVRIRASQGEQASWEVGAVLVHEPSGKSWQMLGISSVQFKGGGASRSGKVVLHERLFQHLEPGSYRLSSFVRDRTASVFGSGTAILELPEAGRDAVAGPVVLLEGRPFLLSDLPDFSKSARGASHAQEIQRGALPAGGAPAGPGETIEVVTLLCPASGTFDHAAVAAYVSAAGKPLSRFEEEAPVPEGSCFRVTHWVPPGLLDPGRYVYHLRWSGGEGRPTTMAEIPFEIAAPPEPPAMPTPDPAAPSPPISSPTTSPAPSPPASSTPAPSR